MDVILFLGNNVIIDCLFEYCVVLFFLIKEVGVC